MLEEGDRIPKDTFFLSLHSSTEHYPAKRRDLGSLLVSELTLSLIASACFDNSARHYRGTIAAWRFYIAYRSLSNSGAPNLSLQYCPLHISSTTPANKAALMIAMVLHATPHVVATANLTM